MFFLIIDQSTLQYFETKRSKNKELNLIRCNSSCSSSKKILILYPILNIFSLMPYFLSHNQSIKRYIDKQNLYRYCIFSYDIVSYITLTKICRLAKSKQQTTGWETTLKYACTPPCLLCFVGHRPLTCPVCWKESSPVNTFRFSEATHQKQQCQETYEARESEHLLEHNATITLHSAISTRSVDKFYV